jgi:GTPase involved in cell partitioning and DNA repair
LESFDVIEKELEDFHLDFSDQQRWICITKIDLIKSDDLSDLINKFQRKFPKTAIYPISSISKDGLDILSEELFKQI